jgi:hypothetical protein
MTRLTVHRRSSCQSVPDFAATAVTGTRKFSVNSSLSAISSDTNPIVKASAASSGLPVRASTTR